MKIRRTLLAVALSLTLGLNLGAQTPAKSAGPLTLQSAADRGLVEYTFTGTGGSSGDSIRLKVKRTSRARGPLTVSVPPGSVLRSSSAGAQSMVVSSVRGIDLGGGLIRGASVMTLNGRAEVTFILSAFCAEFEKNNPSPNTTFSLEKPDRMLACITRKSRNLSIPAEQAAVWMYTDGINYSHMSEKFSVNPGEWSAAAAVVEGCRATVH